MGRCFAGWDDRTPPLTNHKKQRKVPECAGHPRNPLKLRSTAHTARRRPQCCRGNCTVLPAGWWWLEREGGKKPGFRNTHRKHKCTKKPIKQHTTYLLMRLKHLSHLRLLSPIFCWDRVSLLTQAGLPLSAIPLPLPSQCSDYRDQLSCLAFYFPSLINLPPSPEETSAPI